MKKKSYPIFLFILFFILFWIAGFIGFSQLDAEQYGGTLNHIYRSLQLFTLEGPAEVEARMPDLLQIARFGSPIMTILGFLGVLLLTSKEVLDKLLRKLWKRHIIIYGLNDLSTSFALDAQKNGQKVMILASDLNHSALSVVEGRVPIVLANNGKESLFQELRVEYASRFFAFSEEDLKNIEVIQDVESYLDRKNIKEKLKCHIRFSNADLQECIKKHTSIDRVYKSIITSFINVESLVARTVLEDYPLEVKNLANIESSVTVEPFPHLLIYGTSTQALAILRYALLIGHYKAGRKLKISLFTDNALLAKQKLGASFYNIEKIADFRIVELKLNTPSASLSRMLEFTNKEDWCTIFCGWGADEENFNLAQYMRTNSDKFDGRILYSLTKSKSLAKIFTNEVTKTAGNQSLNGCFPLEQPHKLVNWHNVVNEPHEALAKLLHERYLTTVANDGSEMKPSHRDWDELPEVFKVQNRLQADHIAIKLRYMGLSMENSPSKIESAIKLVNKDTFNELAEIEHERWNATKYLTGWEYNEVRNDALQHHNNLKPWHSLSDEVKEYDKNTINNIVELIKKR